MKKLTASLHTHVGSLYDAFIEASRLCNKLKEMGAKGCAITDHGVVSSIEDHKEVFKANGLKLIPGCEIYVDGGVLGLLHLVVLAVNDNGWKGISKIITESNKNLVDSRPVLTREQLSGVVEEYKGDIIALSACMQGVVCGIFRMNEKIEKKMEKLVKKQASYISPASSTISELEKNHTRLDVAYKEAVEKRDRTKSLAEQPFAKRQKAVEKALAEKAEDATRLQNELLADVEAANKAKELLPMAKEAVDEAKKELSKATKALKTANESVQKWFEIEEEITSLKSELKSEEELDKIAREEFVLYQNIFGKDNFYAEIQYHGIPAEKVCYPRLVSIAKSLDAPIVATNDVHILEKSDDERLRRQILRSLRFGTDFEKEQIGDDELYLKSDEELKEALVKIIPEDVVDEAIANIEVIFNRCNVEFKTGKHYPKFSDTKNADELLDEEIEKGVKEIFPDGLTEEYQNRLDYELSVIKKMGYSDYHLVVKDFLEYARLLGYVPKNRLDEAPLSIPELKDFIKKNGWNNKGMLTGPGRGSAVGSLVCYLLKITALDPIKYSLLFERFLNPERVSMPDIDSDISATTRAKVISYVQHKYGENAVCGIMTKTYQQPKGSIRIAAKFYGLKTYKESLLSLGNTITKDVPSEVGVTFSTRVSKAGVVGDSDDFSLYEYLLNKYSENNDAINIIKWAKVIEGSFTAYGAHAAGIVISDNDDISDYIPLKMNQKIGMMTTQCDMVQLEENGLLKFDFLGLKTLDIITEALRMVEENYGEIIDPLGIDLADEDVYRKILAAGKTNSVFQFESTGMKAMLKRFKPTSFEDLIILVSMFRPGPIQYLDGVIDVKNGTKEISYLCPQLEPILGKTYGAIVYQEQVMEIFQKLAGYTLGGADMVRRYMSKKKAEKLAHEKDSFINGDPSRGIKGCVVNGISADVAEELFNQMSEFAKYAFNKSHAAAYALNAYITAWLKYYYPAEFFASALNWADDNEDVAALIYEANSMGIEVLIPDINISGTEFTVTNKKIRYGLSSIAGIKNNADAIIEERRKGPFTSIKDFTERANPSSTTIENLIGAGAFDEFGKNRLSMKGYAAELKEAIPKIKKKTAFVKSAEAVLPFVDRITDADTIKKLQEEKGVSIEITEPTTSEKLQKRIENAQATLLKMEGEVKLIKPRMVSEDKTKRMEIEKSLLGRYISQNPMDYYPAAKDVSAPHVADIKTGNDAIGYGYVSSLVIKARKSDGTKMAFFNLEDRSGTIECCCFAKEYSLLGSIIKEGAVLKIFGSCDIESKDDEDDKKKFFVKRAATVEGKKCAYMMEVSSYAAFHLDIEDAFIETYKDDNGHELLIYDKAMNEIREVPYKVSEKIKSIAKEVY